MTDLRRGVLYVATGAAHAEAARRSAASVRRTNPGLPLAIFSDVAAAGADFDWTGTIDAPHARSKVDYLPRTPFRETLYLDTDTRVLGPLDDLFRLLERFDLAAAQRKAVQSRGCLRQWRHPVPASFPQCNAGVLLYGASPRVLDFLEAWRQAYHAAGFAVDQITLRDLLWGSDLRFAVLPPCCNVRRYTWIEHWFARDRPVILHTNRFHPTKHGPLKRRLAALACPPA